MSVLLGTYQSNRFHLSVLCTCKNQGQGALNISNLNLLDLGCQNLFVKSVFNCLYFDISSSSLKFICCFSLCMIKIVAFQNCSKTSYFKFLWLNCHLQVRKWDIHPKSLHWRLWDEYLKSFSGKMCDLNLNSLGWNRLDEDLNSLSGKIWYFNIKSLRRKIWELNLKSLSRKISDEDLKSLGWKKIDEYLKSLHLKIWDVKLNPQVGKFEMNILNPLVENFETFSGKMCDLDLKPLDWD